MKTKKLPKIITAGVIKNQNKYLFIKETLSDGKDYWIIPGGTVEFGENLQQATIREIKEETNIDIKVVKFLGFNEAIFPDNNYHTIIFFFLCKALKSDIKLEEGQIKDFKFFNRTEIKKEKQLVDSAKWLFKNFKF